MRSLPMTLGCVAVLLTAPAMAQSTGATTPSTAGAHAALNTQETEFLKTAALSGMAEVQMGKMAEQKASEKGVKDFARRMVEDHGKANEHLKKIAAGSNLALPHDLDAADKVQMEDLQKLSGRTFDYHYIGGQKQAHRNAVALFEQEAKSGKHDAVKRFAEQTLPTLRDHLAKADMLAAHLAKENPNLVEGGAMKPGTTGASGTQHTTAATGTAK
ncbi:DUF4142 domain-containing protein [Azospirillum sp. sgz301742]